MTENGNLVNQIKFQQKKNSKRLKNSLKKNKSITLRVTEGQHAKIKSLAETSEQSITQYMIGRAFEHPNFDKSVALGIRNMDWIQNDMIRQEEAIVKYWNEHHTFNTKTINDFLNSRVSMTEKYYELKSALLKTYLTDLEAQKLTEQEKKKKEIECQNRLVELSEKLRGR